MICFALLVSVAVVALTLTLTELHSEVCASVVFLLAHVIECSFIIESLLDLLITDECVADVLFVWFSPLPSPTGRQDLQEGGQRSR